MQDYVKGLKVQKDKLDSNYHDKIVFKIKEEIKLLDVIFFKFRDSLRLFKVKNFMKILETKHYRNSKIYKMSNNKLWLVKSQVGFQY